MVSFCLVSLVGLWVVLGLSRMGVSRDSVVLQGVSRLSGGVS